jgi:hypothetical protein
MEVALMIMDGSKTAKADPAFAAHMDVALHWAQAIWNKWLPVQSLQTSLDYARSRVAGSLRPWSMVTGPAAALILTLERVDWVVHDATNITTDTGRDIELGTDPPIVVARLMEAAVRRWRWRNVAEAHPSLKKHGCTFDPVLKLLNSKRTDDGWNVVLRASLGSIVPNRQYPQERCYRAGWVEHPKCIFCLHSKVACVAHVAAMPERLAAEDSQNQQQQKRQRPLVQPKLPQQ